MRLFLSGSNQLINILIMFYFLCYICYISVIYVCLHLYALHSVRVNIDCQLEEIWNISKDNLWEQLKLSRLV